MCKQCVYRSVAIEMVKCTCQHGPKWKTVSAVSAVRAGQRSHFTLVREMIDTDELPPSRQRAQELHACACAHVCVWDEEFYKL